MEIPACGFAVRGDFCIFCNSGTSREKKTQMLLHVDVDKLLRER